MAECASSILVTGGAGFIGSALCRRLVATGKSRVINLDKLTYSGSLTSLAAIADSPSYKFYRGDVCEDAAVLDILRAERVDAVIHLAAESHVDRSIDKPEVFLRTNVMGTFAMLRAAAAYWTSLKGLQRDRFRFHHVSTDEVMGDLPYDESVFTEDTPYRPSSPYSASKAASDHLVRAWHHTYGLPVVLSNCSNNYGPYQFPEKLIPLTILNAIEGQILPIYGRGENVRDWLFVDDHARALEIVMQAGRVGETYLVGGRSEYTNLQIVEAICDSLDRLKSRSDGKSYREQMSFVQDRPGHDRRYAIDPSKIERELGWSPRETFKEGLEKTVAWYLDNEAWWRPLRNRGDSGARLGMPASQTALDGPR